MLELQDLQAIEEIFDRKLGRIDERFERIDERFAEIDKQFVEMNKKFAEVDKRFTEVNDRFAEVNDRFAKMEKKFIREMDKRIRKSENLLLENMDFDRKVLEARIEKCMERIEQLEQHSNIVKHDENMNDLILRKIEELQNEVEALKLKIA